MSEPLRSEPMRRDDLALFCQAISQGLGKVAARFVRDMVTGIRHAHSVRLMDIARILDEDIPLHATHKRLSRNLANAATGQIVADNLLRMACSRVTDDTRLLLQLFDLEKRYAEKMEFLSPLGHDGDGNGKRGYRLCEVIANDTGNPSFHPVALRPWSGRASGSADDEVLTLIQQVRRASKGNPLIVERSATPYPGLLSALVRDKSCRFVLDQQENIELIYRRRRYTGSDLADRCSTAYATTIYKLWEDIDYAIFCHFGFLPVRLPEFPERPLFLVVVRYDLQNSTYPTPRHLLLTSEPMRRNRLVLSRLVEAFLSLRKIETTNLALKTQYRLSAVQVQKFDRLQTLLSLLECACHWATLEEANALRPSADFAFKPHADTELRPYFFEPPPA